MNYFEYIADDFPEELKENIRKTISLRDEMKSLVKSASEQHKKICKKWFGCTEKRSKDLQEKIDNLAQMYINLQLEGIKLRRLLVNNTPEEIEGLDYFENELLKVIKQ